jgi:hypothetical protein
VSLGLSTSSHLARGIGLAFAIASVAAAQEPTAALNNSGQAQPSIAGAKKQFESIKSARDSALLPESGMPRVTLPALPSPQGSGPPATSTKRAKPDSTKAATGNWLVEAMEKQNDRSDPRRDKSTLRDRGGKLGSETEDRTGTDSDTRDAARDGQGRKDDETSSVVNPLTRYLDDWMTPQDYALLKPGLTSQFDPRAGANNAVLSNPDVPVLPGGLSEFALGGTGVPTHLRGMPKENPYLQSLRPDSIVPPTTVLSKPVVSAPVQPPTVHRIAPPPPLTSPATTKIPDFAKPATDEKYFKQLKRF